MGEVTNISWCDHTFNPFIGCTKVSPACDGCYAEAMMDKRYGRVEWGAPGQGNGTRVRTSDANWKQPIKWNKQAEKDGTRPFVFCASLADVFDNQVPLEWRADLFDLIRATPNLVWLLLTKRPQNIVKMAEAAGGLPANAAIGTTVEDQPRADTNVPALLDAKAALNPAFAFLSCEPLLGPIDLRKLREFNPQGKPWINALSGAVTSGGVPRSRSECGISVTTSWSSPTVDWVITGGETDQGGHTARPTHPEWFRSIRDQCSSAGTPYHHKQNGEFLDFDHIGERWNDLPDRIRVNQQFLNGKAMIKIGKNRSGRMLDGVTHDAFPEVNHG